MGVGGLLGGALTGIGRGMEMQVTAQQREAEQSRADDALMRRQTALAKYQSDLQAERDKTQHGYKVSETREELGIRGQLAAADDVRALSAAERKAQTDFKLDMKKLEAQHTFKLSEQQHEAGLQIARDAASAGAEIAHWEVDSDSGELVGFTKSGRAMRSSVKPLRQKGGSGGILEAYGDSNNDGADGADAPLPTAAPDSSGGGGTSISKQDRLNAINAAMAKGSQGDPRYKGLSGTQIAAKVDNMLRNQGITVK